MQLERSEILRPFDVLRREFDPAEYAAFKGAVAAAIAPHSIVEIGIGEGVAALTFLDASPLGCAYLGIDNDYEYGRKFAVRPSVHVADLLGDRGYHCEILVADSAALTALPGLWYDLAHIDGDHSAAAVEHDVILAWKAGTKWILCDDARDSEVCRGVFSALHTLGRGSVEWAYYPEGSGNLLIRTDHRRGQ